MEHVKSSAAIRRFLLGTSALCVFGSVYAFGQPSGSSVVSGQVSIATPSVNNTIITQSTQKALIEWQNFFGRRRWYGAIQSTQFQRHYAQPRGGRERVSDQWYLARQWTGLVDQSQWRTVSERAAISMSAA